MAAILSFVNLSQQDAFLWVAGADGELQFVAKIASGQMSRQASAAGTVWSVVTADTYQISAGDANRAYLISARGVFQVTATQAVAPEGGTASDDSGFRGDIGSGAPDYRGDIGSGAPEF